MAFTRAVKFAFLPRNGVNAADTSTYWFDYQGVRIAVLDDDESAAQALVDWFEQLGYFAQGYTRADALDQDLAQGFDARFVRTWEFYLAYCEAGFARRNIDVVQYTLRKPE